ncbi:sodium- and chloride-dependent neutral and basic amino acid transporter B(0+)-like isoform X4 [Narcine bancroftii]|uniref:sodium- and chloride-dependent neutral and basic amino acid transporter B(0+)-like isoform X4 n=1 Tax=Narcine bancroftii TaxID=1343680 RepID=UPI003832015B
MDKQGLPLFNFPQNDHQEHSPKDTASPTSEQVGGGDENVERGNWSSKADYLLSMIGCAVGLSNVWRFPYLAYRNGGGAFLIPYTLMLAFIGMPMFFLETSFGQFASLGPVAVWKAVPMLQGVGITMILFSTIIDIVYNCIIAYSLFYLFASFQSPLPWADCFSWWGADETCSRTPRDSLCNLTLDSGYSEIVNSTWLLANNKTCSNRSEIPVPHQAPSEQYWEKSVLQHTSSMDETGKVVWSLALCLLLAWLIVCGALSKGIKSSGKVVYFTATFPYVVLTVLLIRGVTLEGAYKGIEFYIGRESDFSKLANAEIWKDAATQIFYSLAIGWGSLITLSSYNKFHNNCYRDTILICVINCATSVFAGFVIFSILGHMAHIQDKAVSEVAQSGLNSFIKDIEMMIGERSWHFWLWWRMCWYLISPCLMTAIIIWSLITFTSPTYGTVEYPIWAMALGWCMVVFCIMWIPIIAVKKVAQSEGSKFWQKISAACTSTPDWGPYLNEHRGERYSNRPNTADIPNSVQLLTVPEM